MRQVFITTNLDLSRQRWTVAKQLIVGHCGTLQRLMQEPKTADLAMQARDVVSHLALPIAAMSATEDPDYDWNAYFKNEILGRIRRVEAAAGAALADFQNAEWTELRPFVDKLEAWAKGIELKSKDPETHSQSYPADVDIAD